MSDTTVDSVLIVEKESDVAWVKLHRPKVANCLNRELLKALMEALTDLAEDKNTRVICIIGAGLKAFCAGADLAERKTMSQDEVIAYISLIQKVMRTIETMPQPVIAALNGSAFGGGFEMALACDLRVMVNTAELKLTEVRLGIIPGAGGTQRLPRLIGKSRAKEVILAATPLTAKEAHHIGLVHKVIELDHTFVYSEEGKRASAGAYLLPLIEEVRKWAHEIAKAAPLSLKQAKIAIDDGYDRDMESALAIEKNAYMQLINTKDRLEGLAAFAEKRSPVYKGE
ncbi:MAG: enoyl-CoA hydratase/isomerase family protein [Cyanobacteria bacterium REEB67]|nr:enoyl-CoA hydratase/isomerase family protein [Cyanobacteria bacterium REEB67]